MRNLNLISSPLAMLLLALTSVGLAQDTGRLQTQVKPKVAGIFVDGKYQGIAADFRSGRSALVLPAGQHQVRIVDPRYEVLDRIVNVQAGQTEVIRENLTPKTLARPPFGPLKIKGWGHAAVYLNGAFYGHADEFNDPGQALLLPPGEYDLRVAPLDGGQPLERKITITANQKTVITGQ